MHKFNLIGGALLIILCIAVFPRKKAETAVYSSGNLVDVEVTRIPASCEGSAKFRFMHFRYKGREHSIKIGSELCQLIHVGQTTQLQHMDKYPNIFLTSSTNTKLENISWASLFLLGCYAFTSSLIKLKQNSSPS